MIVLENLKRKGNVTTSIAALEDGIAGASGLDALLPVVLELGRDLERVQLYQLHAKVIQRKVRSVRLLSPVMGHLVHGVHGLNVPRPVARENKVERENVNF